MSDYQEQIGFQSQGTFSGNCGQRSLIHSLLLLGIPVSERTAHERTKVGWFTVMFRGTGEEALEKAIERSGCIASLNETFSADEARRRIDGFLDCGMPVIVNMNGVHWFVLAGKTPFGRYWWIDSSDYPLMGSASWSRVQDWMTSNDHHFVFIGVRPAQDDQLERSLIPNFSKVSDLWDDEDLADWWGYYLEDLADMFDCPTDGSGLTASDFFSRFSKEIVDSIEFYHGDAERASLKWEIGNYEKVAVAHRMSISEGKVHSALIKLSAAITLVA
jgi:hypothetical protein